MNKISYSVTGTTAVVTMQDGKNSLNISFLDEFQQVLDQIENETEACTLIVGSAHEKVFCDGIDLGWFSNLKESGDLDRQKLFFYKLQSLFRRLLLYPLLTVAAVNGHAFAAGAVLCCAMDFRFMRSDQGFFCFPEIDVGVPFLPSTFALCRKVMPAHVFNDLIYTGKRLTGLECEALGLVSKSCPNDELMPQTIAFADSLKKRREIIGAMKTRANRSIVETIDKLDPPAIEEGRFSLF